MILLLLPSNRCSPLYWGLDQVAQLAPPPYSCSVRIFISYLFSLTNRMLPYSTISQHMTCDCQLLFFLEIFQQNSKDPQNGLSMLLCKSFGGPSSQLWKPFVIWIFYSGKVFSVVIQVGFIDGETVNLIESNHLLLWRESSLVSLKPLEVGELHFQISHFLKKPQISCLHFFNCLRYSSSFRSTESLTCHRTSLGCIPETFYH